METAAIQRQYGEIYVFKKSVSGWNSEPDIHDKLTELTGSGPIRWEYRSASSDSVVESYDQAGDLVEIRSPAGEYFSFDYERDFTYGIPKLKKITDQAGRVWEVSYDELNRITEVGLPDGGNINYEYDAASDMLSSVTYPNGEKREYVYGEGQYGRSYQLTGINDQNGVRRASWRYDAIGRAWLSVHGDEYSFVDRVEFTYLGSPSNIGFMVKVKKWIGGSNPIEVTYNYSGTKYGRPLFGGFSSLCSFCDHGSEASVTYDVNGNVDVVTDFNGVTTDYEFDSRGLEVVRVDASNDASPLATSAKRTTETMWNANFRVPEQRSVKNVSGTIESMTRWAHNVRGQVVARCEIDPNDVAAMAYTCSATSDPPTGAMVQRWVTTYCEQADVASGTCPRAGLTMSTNGPRPASDPGMSGADDLTIYSYYAQDASGCANSNNCPYRRGDLWKITNALGHVTEYVSYDKAGRVKRTKDANGTITDFVYHIRGWLKERTVRAKADGTPLPIADASLYIEYDAVGNVVKVVQPDAAYLEYTYDDAHRLIAIADNLGNTIDYCPGGPGSADCLDAAGNRRVEQVKDPSNNVKRQLRRTYNQLSQLTQVLNASSQAVETSAGLNATGIADGYDGNGNRVLVEDGLGTVMRQEYDALNRLKATIQDLGGTDPSTADATTQYAYDTRDNLRQVTDPDGLPTVYDYDGLNHLTGLHSPDTGDTAYTYDAAGNRISQTDARGVTSTYTYDALNRLTGVAYPDPDLDIAYGYDEAHGTNGCSGSQPKGRLTTMGEVWGETRYCYDRRGNVTKKIVHEKGKTAQVTQYSYTLADRLATITYPSGAVVTYTRNALGQVQGVSWKPTVLTPPTLIVSSTTYAPFGPLTSITYGNGRTQTRAYDQDYAIDAISGTPTGALTLDFEVDVMGSIVEASNSLSPVAPDRVYTYDPMYRLTKAKTGATPPAPLEAYTYNPTGDRLSASLNGNPADAYTYVPNTHRLASVGAAARTYDDNGNTLTGLPSGYALSYDDRNRLRQATKPPTNTATYRYNGKGERMGKAVSNGLFATVTAFAYDEGGRLLGEYDDAGNVLAEYVYLDEIPITVIKNGAPYYIEADHLGTPRQVIDPVANIVLWKWDFLEGAFGTNIPHEDTDNDGTPFRLNLRFAGQYSDFETDLNHNRRREYDLVTGRFVQSDPIGLNGGISTYSYVGSNPLVAIDPTGLFTWTGTMLAYGVDRRGFGITQELYTLTSECVSNVRYMTRVLATYGTWSVGVPVTYAGSNVEFEDHLVAMPLPEVFNGVAKTYGISLAIGVGIGLLEHTQLGGATSDDWVSAKFGLDESVGYKVGNSSVLWSFPLPCCDSR